MAGGSPASVGGRKQRSSLCATGARNQQAAGGRARAGQRGQDVGCGAPGVLRMGGAFTTTLARSLVYTTLMCLVACGLLLGVSGAPAGEEDVAFAKQQLTGGGNLEAELRAILDQQSAAGGPIDDQALLRAIMEKLQLSNQASNVSQAPEAESEPREGPAAVEPADEANFLSAPNVAGLRRMMSLLQNFEATQTSANPVLPASPAVNIKRAAARVSNFMRQQPLRQLGGYGRINSFDFGLGKRPDSSVSGNILRFGDPASAGSHMAAVSGSGLGKRPSARYDFGLGKRLASPAYPRYAFGLGKRAPSRVRYDFGLGK